MSGPLCLDQVMLRVGDLEHSRCGAFVRDPDGRNVEAACFT